MTKQNDPYKTSFKKHDLIKEGWALIEDVVDVIESINDLEPVSFFTNDKRFIGGETLQQIAKKIGGNFGHNQAEYLFNHRDEIPGDWSQNYFVFPGTVWRDTVGDLRVLCLDWMDGQWSFGFDWLGYDWNSPIGRLVCRRNK